MSRKNIGSFQQGGNPKKQLINRNIGSGTSFENTNPELETDPNKAYEIYAEQAPEQQGTPQEAAEKRGRIEEAWRQKRHSGNRGIKGSIVDK